MKRFSMFFILLLFIYCIFAQSQNSFLIPERKIQIDESQTEITVRTNIKGCSVYLNGIYKGTTPLKIKNLITGNYELKLEKTDYAPAKAFIKVVRGISYDYLIQMKKNEFNADNLQNQ